MRTAHTRERPRKIPLRKTVIILTGLLALLLLTTGCINLDPVTNATNNMLAALDDAINALGSANADWQMILRDLEKKIPAELDSTIRNDISSTINRAVSTAGVEFRCSVDFAGDRVRQQLIRIRAKLLKQPPPEVEPAFCNVDPPALDMNLPPDRRNKVELFGYDMDTVNVKVSLQNNTAIVDLTPRLTRQTHYHMTVNLGGTPDLLSASSQKLILNWKGSEISAIPVIQPTTPVCKSEVSPSITLEPITWSPPPTRGDREFQGHGPQVYASVSLTNHGTHVNATIFMVAKETQSDWTEASGSMTKSIYPAPPGRKIERIIGDLSQKYSYLDTDTTDDNFGGGSGGPVSSWVFVGDGPTGNDAGGDTKVTVHFNPLKVVLTETTNCVPPLTITHMQSKQLLSPATALRYEPELRTVDPVILKLPFPGNK